MRYTLIPKELDSAYNTRKYQAHKARNLAEQRLASEQRKKQRTTNFWSILLWSICLVTFAVAYSI
jgi:hypothetical protein